jgi:hypothetical protein
LALRERLLITTALEETWGSGDAVYFLGEWCKLYSKKDFWSKLDSKTQSHHWNDRSKLKKEIRIRYLFRALSAHPKR